MLCLAPEALLISQDTRRSLNIAQTASNDLRASHLRRDSINTFLPLIATYLHYYTIYKPMLGYTYGGGRCCVFTRWGFATSLRHDLAGTERNGGGGGRGENLLLLPSSSNIEPYRYAGIITRKVVLVVVVVCSSVGLVLYNLSIIILARWASERVSIVPCFLFVSSPIWRRVINQIDRPCEKKHFISRATLSLSLQ